MIKRLIYLILIIIYIIPALILASFALAFLGIIDVLIWLITGKEVNILDKMIYCSTSFPEYLNRKLWQKD